MQPLLAKSIFQLTFTAFGTRHYLALALLIFTLAVMAEYSGFDLWLARQFYDAQQQTWPYRNGYLTKTILHDYAQHAIRLIAMLVIALVAASWKIETLRRYRRELVYLLLVLASGPLLVGLLKSVTHIQIPWRLAEFSGSMPYIRLFDPVAPGIPVGHAFPGGHSSGGFALFGLYFLCERVAPRYRYLGLMTPLTIGSLFAVNQEIRGAHFLSHDLVSMAICWAMAVFWARIYLGRPFAKATN